MGPVSVDRGRCYRFFYDEHGKPDKLSRAFGCYRLAQGGAKLVPGRQFRPARNPATQARAFHGSYRYGHGRPKLRTVHASLGKRTRRSASHVGGFPVSDGAPTPFVPYVVCLIEHWAMELDQPLFDWLYHGRVIEGHPPDRQVFELEYAQAR
jgi:hypothetical protein